jgi:hypothetical protein
VRAELSDLVHRYAALVDDRDFAAAAALFTPHGVLVRPEPPDVLDPVEEVKGRPAIEQALRTLEGVGLTIHAIGVAHHLLDPRTDLVWHLRYRDRYEQDGDRWLIGRRELSIDLIETRAVKRSRGSS